MTQDRVHYRRWLLPLAKFVIVLLLLWGVQATLRTAIDGLTLRLAAGQWRLQPGWIVAAGALYLLGLLPCGVFWHRVLLAVSQESSLARTLRAYYIGHLGKYVPGKAMVVILRTALVKAKGQPSSIVAVSVLYETLTMMAAGAFLAAAVLGLWRQEQPAFAWLSLGLMALAGLPTLPPVFRRLCRMGRVGRGDAAATASIERMDYRLLATGWPLAILSWLLLGLSLWATLRGLGLSGLEPFRLLPLYVAAVSLATVAGFLSLIPGGALVREFVLLELLVLLPGVDPATALLGALLLRLIWLVAELLISAILYAAAFLPPFKARLQPATD